MHEPDAKSQIWLDRDLKRKGHEHGGIPANVVEGVCLYGTVASVIRTELVRTEPFIDREHQPGPTRDDHDVPADCRNTATRLTRSFEEHHAALASDIPLEAPVAWLLSGDVGRPETKGQHHDRN